MGRSLWNTNSIIPTRDILQILLAITYVTSCNKKNKIKVKTGNKYKIDFPSPVSLKCIGKQGNVHSGLVVLAPPPQCGT